MPSGSHRTSPTETAAIPKRPSLLNLKVFWGGVTVMAIALSLQKAGIGEREIINPGGFGLAAQFLLAALHPDLSPDLLLIMGRAMGVTLAYGICGAALSVGLGLVGGVLSSAVWWRTLRPIRPNQLRPSVPIWLMVRGLLAIPRAIHELIWGLFFVNILGLDPLVAVLAIAIPFGAITAKVFSEILDETPHQPLNALLNSGVPPLPAFLYGLLPQAFPNLLSYTFYRLECAIRSSAVLGVIGAGGLGYEIFLSLQSLRYEQLWTGFYALILLNGVVDAWSAKLRRQMGFTSRLDLNMKKGEKGKGIQESQLRPPPIQNSKSKIQNPKFPLPQFDGFLPTSWFLLALAIPLCFWSLQLDWSRLWAPRTLKLLAEVAQSAKPHEVDFGALWRLSTQTVAMSILAIAMAGLGGVVFSFPAAQNFFLPGGLLRPMGQSVSQCNVGQWGLLLVSRLALLVSRAIPAPIWALVFLYGLFPGILPGAIALGMHNFGILGRLMAEVNENLDDRPVRALRALGASSSQVALYGILPQNLPRFLAYILYRWEVCMRETVVVGLVGAGGLGRLMMEQLSSFDYGGLTVTLGVLIVLTFGVDLVSAAMRQALR